MSSQLLALGGLGLSSSWEAPNIPRKTAMAFKARVEGAKAALGSQRQLGSARYRLGPCSCRVSVLPSQNLKPCVIWFVTGGNTAPQHHFYPLLLTSLSEEDFACEANRRCHPLGHEWCFSVFVQSRFSSLVAEHKCIFSFVSMPLSVRDITWYSSQ